MQAYQAIIDEHDVSTLSLEAAGKTLAIETGIPDRMEFYRQQLASRDLTVAERLLSYVRQDEDVFATKQTGKRIAEEGMLKDQAAVDYILDSITENMSPIDSASSELSDEERQETQDELEVSVNTKKGELPDIGNPFADDYSHNQKPLEPNKDSTE